MRRQSLILLASLLVSAAAVAVSQGDALAADQGRIEPDAGLAVGSGLINVPIPDNAPAGVSTDLAPGVGGAIVDLDLTLWIDHTWVGDLRVTLTHVDTGTSAVVIDRPGYPAVSGPCSYDNINVTLDDEATLPVEDQCANANPAINGTFTPNSPLSAFDGESLSGTWRLTLVDTSSVDVGALTYWALGFGVMQCNGAIATIVGAPGPDVINGSSGSDVITGLSGNDRINGQGGEDLICGGPGADTLIGGPGAVHDTLLGGVGKDTVSYAGSPSYMVVDLAGFAATGGEGPDELRSIENVIGSAFADTIYGSVAANRLLGGGAGDHLIGRGGNDRLFGQSGNDTLDGGSGDDTLTGGVGIDSANGGPGTDTCSAETVTGCTP